jgi:hypothetical protein
VAGERAPATDTRAGQRASLTPVSAPASASRTASAPPGHRPKALPVPPAPEIPSTAVANRPLSCGDGAGFLRRGRSRPESCACGNSWIEGGCCRQDRGWAGGAGEVCPAGAAPHPRQPGPTHRRPLTPASSRCPSARSGACSQQNWNGPNHPATPPAGSMATPPPGTIPLVPPTRLARNYALVSWHWMLPY